ncbi:secreted antigen 1 [Babesia caballi]|uniref:Secreted antigen 1 n=1 Tax=Babesia caballi TaxID=5871 RepID=A0AAV4LML1_BABCB|nr:secreted antigen 1 [Babesia caballi]
MTAVTDTINQPKTLRAALDFLAKLYKLGVADQVGEALKSKVKTAINRLISSGALSDISFIHDIIENLKNVLIKASNLRDEVVSRPRKTKYGNYNVVNLHNRAEECATILLDILPDLYNTLFYLNLNVSGSFWTRGGGQWSEESCNGSGGITNYMCSWLVNPNAIPSSKSSTDVILPGGYGKHELSRKDGEILQGALLEFVDDEDNATCFSSLLVNLIFATSLTAASTATTCVLVSAFCRAVSKGIFSSLSGDVKYSNLSNICANVVSNLKFIAPGDEEVNNSNLIALCQGTVDYCESKLKPSDFDICVQWFKIHLATVIGHLRQMNTACKKWVEIEYNHGKHAGPFSYGFMVGKAWDGGPYVGQVNLHPVIQTLSGTGDGSLWTLLKCINPETQPIVDNELTQQENRRVEAPVEADSAPADLGSEPGSSAATGMVSETRVDASAVSAAGEVQTGRQNAQSSGGGTGESIRSDGAQSNSSSEGHRSDENRTTGQENRDTTKDVHPQTAMGGGSLSESSSRRTEPQTDAVQSQPNEALAHPGSSGVTGEPDVVGSGTSDSNGDNSTITIGSAAGGVAVLGGGGAALYFLNVGGIKTLITGVP